MTNLIKFLFAVTFFAPAALAASPVVFIHGIKGAELRGPDGELFWLSTSQALGISNAEISLPLRFEADGSQARDKLAPTGIMAEIPLIPYLYAVDVYGPFLDMGKECGRAFLPFAYDWRRDNGETLLRFEQFVEAAAKKSPTGKVSVVAHSMGGLLTLALLNKRPELFDGATFAGVPFKGGIGFLADLHVGADTGLNSKIAGPEVLATFPSVFTLFPLKNDDYLLDLNNAALPFDFFRAEDWKRLKLGPYAEGRAQPPGYDAFLAGALARARAFRERLVFRPGTAYPPIQVINSKAHPTLHQVIVGGRQVMAGVDFETAPKFPGDGRVAFVTSLPPDGFKYTVVATDEEHSALLNDPKAAAAALAFPGKPSNP